MNDEGEAFDFVAGGKVPQSSRGVDIIKLLILTLVFCLPLF
jgi:hypothetical protein